MHLGQRATRTMREVKGGEEERDKHAKALIARFRLARTLSAEASS